MEQTINIEELVQDDHNLNKGTAEGQLMRTTLREWVEFSVRNVDFTKKRNGRMA